MSTFGHDKWIKADFETVRVCLMADGEGIIINALVSPVISPPISAHLQDDDLNFPYLQGLRLADPVRTRGPLEIDIIIGNDYYWSLVTREIIKGDGPMVMNSKFGWLLSGPVIQAEQPKEIIETQCYRIEIKPAQSPHVTESGIRNPDKIFMLESGIQDIFYVGIRNLLVSESICVELFW